DRGVLQAARRTVLPEQPGGLLCPGAASPQCCWQASPPGSGDLRGGAAGRLPPAPPAAGGDLPGGSHGRRRCSSAKEVKHGGAVSDRGGGPPGSMSLRRATATGYSAWLVGAHNAF